MILLGFELFLIASILGLIVYLNVRVGWLIIGCFLWIAGFIAFNLCTKVVLIPLLLWMALVFGGVLYGYLINPAVAKYIVRKLKKKEAEWSSG